MGRHKGRRMITLFYYFLFGSGTLSEMNKQNLYVRDKYRMRDSEVMPITFIIDFTLLLIHITS